MSLLELVGNSAANIQAAANSLSSAEEYRRGVQLQIICVRSRDSLSVSGRLGPAGYVRLCRFNLRRWGKRRYNRKYRSH